MDGKLPLRSALQHGHNIVGTGHSQEDEIASAAGEECTENGVFIQ